MTGMKKTNNSDNELDLIMEDDDLYWSDEPVEHIESPDNLSERLSDWSTTSPTSNKPPAKAYPRGAYNVYGSITYGQTADASAPAAPSSKPASKPAPQASPVASAASGGGGFAGIGYRLRVPVLISINGAIKSADQKYNQDNPLILIGKNFGRGPVTVNWSYFGIEAAPPTTVTPISNTRISVVSPSDIAANRSPGDVITISVTVGRNTSNSLNTTVIS